jgi:hypothetical protein
MQVSRERYVNLSFSASQSIRIAVGPAWVQFPSGLKVTKLNGGDFKNTK